ncbi:MAG: adenylosuccinate synthase [Clostridiales bacterium]|nr:adenylosuccinate synthase [Clostridiales bacterium]MCF8022498.1 adenylosuccinate synthase [Clostridiales bacterium]
MSTVVLIGAQWGDEGKGKVTDYLAEKAEIVVRYAGGNNAGHTVVVGDQTFQLHLIPSGILYADKPCIVGNGTVIDPEVLLDELEGLKNRGISIKNLRISPKAHVIMPYHRIIDAADEKSKGTKKIGTTGRGIGPAYSDKASRVGIRVTDLIDEENFPLLLKGALEEKNRLLRDYYGIPEMDYNTILKDYQKYAADLKQYVEDISVLVEEAIKEDKNILFEGAQGTLLDLDHGTYPYVTSSHPIAASACLGTGIGPTRINRVAGVAKAYVTRVGSGPFPTELFDNTGDYIRKQGHEYGTTTGRPRRCGWFDAVVARYSARVNGLDYLAVTKLDVLTGLDTIKICTGYKYRGEVISEFPCGRDALKDCEPCYEEFSGWKDDISLVRNYQELPDNAKKYLERVSEVSGVPVGIIGVGPKRDQTIILKEMY